VKFIKNILECFPALKVTREGRFTMKELTARKIFTEVGNSSATSTSTLAQPSRDSKVEVPWLVVEFSEEELTWSAFNYTVIGSPDPNVAFEGSIRKSLQDNAGQFGLSKAAFNLIHNGIHASNGPLGVLRYMMTTYIICCICVREREREEKCSYAHVLTHKQ
jgi:hypothetical protein